MRILITGLPLFSMRLAKALQEFDPQNRYMFFDTYYSKKDLLRFMLHLPFADAVISMNGVTDQSKTLDLVLRLRKKLVMQWMGSDAMYALDRQQKGTLKREYLDYATHFVDAPWIAEEVTALGVHQETVHFKFFTDLEEPVVQYDKLRVVTYISQKRQEFYGMPWVRLLAEHHPEIDFLVFGADEADEAVPANVKLFGWTAHDVFQQHVREGALFLRFTAHDGFPVSVMEAMAYGAVCLTRLPIPDAIHVKDESELVPLFQEALKRVTARGMKPDFAHAARIKSAFTRSHILGEYVNRLQKLTSK